MTSSVNFDKIQLFQNVPFNTFYYINGNGNYTQFPLGNGVNFYPEGTKYYFAILNQSGTNAPVPSGIQTNLDANSITFGYSNVGVYTINSDGLFIVEKTFFFIQSTGTNLMGIDRGLDPTNSMRMRSNAANSFTTANNVMVNIPLQIIIFP